MLTLTDVTVTFCPGTANEKKALDGLSLHLAPGDFVTVVGANGAGKSTLLEVIAGTCLPDSGTVRLDGRDITRLPDHRRSRAIGRLFQDPLRGTAPGMTVGENLALAYLRAGERNNPFSFVGRRDRALFYEKLRQLGLGLEARMDQSVGQLSGGQRQALTLLMATLVPPKLLLLDEHTAALDPAAAATVRKLTEHIVREGGITCLMITHDLLQALTLGDRTVLMADGRVERELTGGDRAAVTPEMLLHMLRGGKNPHL